MKLSQLQEAKYSDAGRVFEEYWVLYLPGDEYYGYAYFNPEYGVQTNEFPKLSGRFDSKEKALNRLSRWKKNINVKLTKIIHYRETPLPRAPRRPRTGRSQEYWKARSEHSEHKRHKEDDERFNQLTNQHDLVNKVVVTKVTVRAE